MLGLALVDSKTFFSEGGNLLTLCLLVIFSIAEDWVYAWSCITITLAEIPAADISFKAKDWVYAWSGLGSISFA